MNNQEWRKIDEDAFRKMLLDISVSAKVLSVKDPLQIGKAFPIAAMIVIHSQFCRAAGRHKAYDKEFRYREEVWKNIDDLLAAIERGTKMRKDEILEVLLKTRMALLSYASEERLSPEDSEATDPAPPS